MIPVGIFLKLHDTVLSKFEEKKQEQWRKSFINKLSNKRPSIEPWGTPRSTEQD